MIGVLVNLADAAAAEEFFQLFKTPWEFFQQGRSYDVVIACTDEIPELDAKLLLIYSSSVTSFDRQANLVPRSRLRQVTVDYGDTRFPIYGNLLTLAGSGTTVLAATSTGESAGLQVDSSDPAVVRFGYDLFQEVAALLTVGQPVENARIPTLEIHILLLRECILGAGVSIVEIPPVPAGYGFITCLTHDIDFVGIRRHKFDHTILGFLYRATLGAVRNYFRGRISFMRLLKNWQATLTLPFVHLGWAKDFWLPFDWYLEVEKDLPATYFLIPFRKRAGDKVSVPRAEKRAAPYDIGDIPEWTARLVQAGCEIGVHGIDAWHSVDKAREEFQRVAAVVPQPGIGVRMHWLLRDQNTLDVLDQSGYDYDSTSGYNETPGYLCGTTQVFRPLGGRTLLELPMHIQDGALFFRERLDLSEAEAWELCVRMIREARKYGGVTTVLWHDRSPGPERFWGDFYVRLVREIKAQKPWFASAGQAVSWFRQRRSVVFERQGAGDVVGREMAGAKTTPAVPPMVLRVHRARRSDEGTPRHAGEVAETFDLPWTGETQTEVSELLCPSETARDDASVLSFRA